MQQALFFRDLIAVGYRSGALALVSCRGLTIAARIWSAVSRVSTPFNDGALSSPA